MSLELTDCKSPLAQVMAWCHQATSHYLSQYWPRFMSPYGVTRPQGVKQWSYISFPLKYLHQKLTFHTDHLATILICMNICTIKIHAELNIIKCCYNVVQYIMKLHTALQWQVCRMHIGHWTHTRHLIPRPHGHGMGCLWQKIEYRLTSNISRTLVGNKIVDHSDVVEAPNTSSFST